MFFKENRILLLNICMSVASYGKKNRKKNVWTRNHDKTEDIRKQREKETEKEREREREREKKKIALIIANRNIKRTLSPLTRHSQSNQIFPTSRGASLLYLKRGGRNI